MKCRTLLLIVLFAILETMNASAARNWQLEVSANQRFLQYSDGTPFFWLADTGWLLPEELNRGEAKGYLAECARQGYNVVQVQTICGVPCVNAYGQLSNVSKSNPWDFSNINREGVYGYWDHMDFIIKEAEKNGIYIAMTCIWGGLVKSGLMDIEGAKSYGRFLAERYKESPNIIWMIGGDIQGDINPDVWNTLANTIKSIDNKHIMTYHPRGRYTSAKWWSRAEWLDFHTYQSGHRAYGQRMGNKEYPIPDNTEEDCFMYVDSTWNGKPVKPVLDAEPSYEDIPVGLHFPDGPRWKAHDVRRYAYWDVFAGCCGHTYGHNAIMQMHKAGEGVAYARDCKPWYEAQKDSGYVSMKYLKALMLQLPYFDRIPDQSVIIGNGEKYERLSATRGKDYVLVYNYTSRDMTVDMSGISGKRKNVWWMDAATGNLAFCGTFNNGKQTFKPMLQTLGNDNIHDGVLIIIDADKNYIADGMTNILQLETKTKKDLTE